MDFDDLFEEDAAQFEDYGDAIDQGPEFHEEADAFERVGPSGRLAEMVSGTTLGDMQKELARQSLSPEDRFLVAVDAISRRLNSDHIAKISEADISNLLTKTSMIPGLRYKNPVAYILGYLATNGGRKMDHATVLHVITKVLPKLGDEGGVAPPDVIRYGRYWIKYL